MSLSADSSGDGLIEFDGGSQGPPAEFIGNPAGVEQNGGGQQLEFTMSGSGPLPHGGNATFTDTFAGYGTSYSGTMTETYSSCTWTTPVTLTFAGSGLTLTTTGGAGGQQQVDETTGQTLTALRAVFDGAGREPPSSFPVMFDAPAPGTFEDSVADLEGSGGTVPVWVFQGSGGSTLVAEGGCLADLESGGGSVPIGAYTHNRGPFAAPVSAAACCGSGGSSDFVYQPPGGGGPLVADVESGGGGVPIGAYTRNPTAFRAPVSAAGGCSGATSDFALPGSGGGAASLTVAGAGGPGAESVSQPSLGPGATDDTATGSLAELVGGGGSVPIGAHTRNPTPFLEGSLQAGGPADTTVVAARVRHPRKVTLCFRRHKHAHVKCVTLKAVRVPLIATLNTTITNAGNHVLHLHVSKTGRLILTATREADRLYHKHHRRGKHPPKLGVRIVVSYKAS